MEYYGAYGSNIHKSAMAVRCPLSWVIKTDFISDYKLVFGDGLATIIKAKGSKVPITIWKIGDSDERSLDVYEGYPDLYTKKTITTDSGVDVMVYIMNHYTKLYPPNTAYFNEILKGYNDFKFDVNILQESIRGCFE